MLGSIPLVALVDRCSPPSARERDGGPSSSPKPLRISGTDGRGRRGWTGPVLSVDVRDQASELGPPALSHRGTSRLHVRGPVTLRGGVVGVCGPGVVGRRLLRTIPAGGGREHSRGRWD